MSTIKDIIVNAKGLPIVIAQYLKEDLGDIIVCDEQLYSFNKKYYEPLDGVVFGRKFLSFLTGHGLSNYWTSSREKETAAALLRLPSVTHTALDNYEAILNFKNGVFDLDSMELVPHKKDFYFSWYVNIDYNPKATAAPVFTEFLNSTFNGDQDTIETLLMIGGYLLYPRITMEKMFVFLGNGANGKSTLINIFQMFFDEKFITSLSLMTLSGKGMVFQREQLMHSKLNIAGEEDEGRINSNEIKKIISGQAIDIARKNKDGVNFKPRTKIIVDSNGVPYFQDNSHGTKRRLFIINFNNTYLDTKDYAQALIDYGNPANYHIYPMKDYDEMMKAITAELPAILNMFLAGLKRLKELKWQLPVSKHVGESMAEYENVADNWKTWMKATYQLDTTTNFLGIEYSQIYDDYQAWYVENYGKHSAISKIKFSKRLQDFYKVKPTKTVKRDMTGKLIHFTYYPLKLKPEDPATKMVLDQMTNQPSADEDTVGQINF